MSPMAQLYLRNAKKVECVICLPADRYFRDSNILQDRAKKIPQFLSIRLHLQNRPIRFNGPETVADVPVAGHEMYSQAILGCRDFPVGFFPGWTDKHV